MFDKSSIADIKSTISRLEFSCPLLKAHAPEGWRDFRDDSTEWRSGIYVNRGDHTQMKAIFGSRKTCLEAQKQLAKLNIESTVKESESTFWIILFSVDVVQRNK